MLCQRLRGAKGGGAAVWVVVACVLHMHLTLSLSALPPPDASPLTRNPDCSTPEAGAAPNIVCDPLLAAHSWLPAFSCELRWGEQLMGQPTLGYLPT